MWIERVSVLLVDAEVLLLLRNRTTPIYCMDCLLAGQTCRRTRCNLEKNTLGMQRSRTEKNKKGDVETVVAQSEEKVQTVSAVYHNGKCAIINK